MMVFCFQDAFARAFVQHYSRISVMLVQSRDSETLSNRVVHVSVQLFSDQDLAYRMTDSFHLLHVMIVSLKNMMKSICVPSALHGKLLCIPDVTCFKASLFDGICNTVP